MIEKNDEFYMNMAIDIMEKGIGKVNPNPLVGCVVVKNNEIIATGYHEYYGGYHAERNALLSLKNNESENATLYVTLEPCCHHGKTPPCTDIIISSKIKKVVVACLDPNPLVAGKGIEILKNNGIEVTVGCCQEKALSCNDIFFHYIKNKQPYVIMKYAMTLDGKIATTTGESKWITGEVARENVHKDRNKYSSIMVGVGTVIADNPMLDCRLTNVENTRNPIRIICDTNLRTPIDCRIVQSANSIKTIIATSVENKEKYKEYEFYGCEILYIPKYKNHIDLKVLIEKIGEKAIDSIFIEGGSVLNFSALECGIVNKIQAYIAPKIFGGELSKTPVSGMGILDINNCIKIKNKKIINLGEDILIEGEVEN